MPMPQIITTVMDLKEISADWLQLVRQDPESSYFMTPDWGIAWSTHLGANSVRVACWRDDQGRLDALVGLSSARESILPRSAIGPSVLTNLGSGSGAADHCGWAVPIHRTEEVTKWLEESAASRPLLLRDIDPSSEHLMPKDAIPVASSPCPRLVIPDDPSEVGRSSKFRKQLRYYRRQIDKHGVTFSWVRPEATDPSHVDMAIELHRRRRSLKDDDTTFTDQRRPFHRALQRSSGPGRGPSLIIAEHEGRPIGMIYGFVWQDTFSFYQSGWEPEWAGENLGTVLIAEAIRMVAEAGIAVFDFLRGPEKYKYRFGASDRIDKTWLLPTGLSGRALRYKYQVKSRRNERATASE